MSKIKFSEEEEQEIIELYKTGLSMAKVGKQYGISSASVMRILDKNNIPKRTKGGIYKIPDEEVIKRYKNGESCQSIANDFNVSFHSISNILEKYNIKRDNRYHNLSLDQYYFHTIDHPDKAYFLGFLLTDGNVSDKENTIRLSLATKDIEILEIFKQKTGNSNQISVRENNKHSERTFNLRSAQWKKDLAQYSVTPRKTLTCTMPNLDEDMMPHLIRGMIDGDGWISYKSHQLGFCGNEQVVTQLRNYLIDKLKVYPVAIIHSEENLWQVSWASKKDIEKIGIFIYQNKEDCYLKRKFNNFMYITHGNTEVSN